MMPLIDFRHVSTGRVIQEIEIRPILWDSKLVNSKNKIARRQAWHEVFCALMPDFEQMSAIDQKNADRAIQQRWKTARDAYFRSKALSRQGLIKKKYFYYDNLTFLDKVQNDNSGGCCTQSSGSRQPQTTYNTTESENNNLHEPTTHVTHAVVKVENESDGDETNYDYNIPEVTIDPIDTGSCDSIDVGPRSLKRKFDNDFNNTICDLLSENAQQLRNDNMTFFLSMLPVVDKFNDLQKLTFRAEVINIAKKIAEENANSSSSATVTEVKFNLHKNP